MKLVSILVIASAVVLMASTSADAYRYRRHRPFYDAAYIGSHQRLGYRGALYGLAGPAYAFGDPSYGGCRLGHELIGTAWGPRLVRVRACPVGSGIYRSRYFGY